MGNEQARILLVENDPAHVSLARRCFAAESGSFDLDVAPTLTDAKRKIRCNAPSLVITDLLLPDGLGTELIGAGEKAPPVVIMTSHGDEQVAVEAIKRGALDYVVKSEAAIAEIVHITRRALRQWQLIVERNRAESALRGSESRFRQLAENSQQVFWLVSADLRDTLYVSPAFERITGRTCHALYANPNTLLDDVHPDDRPLVRAELRRVTTGESSRRRELEFRIVRRDGRLRWARMLMFSVFDSAGTPYRVGGIMEDVTERKQAEEKLQQRENQLAHVTRLSTMGELLTGIAHEVNQPLYAISNYAWACSRSLASNDRPLPVDKLKKWCEEIQSAAQRASEIIKRLREFTQRADHKRETINLNDVVEQSIDLLSHEARRQQVVLQREMSATPPTVLAAPIQIQQVMVNLLRNACEAFPEDSGPTQPRVVRMTTRIVGQYAEVLVTDLGVGIPEDPEPLFDAFVTTKPTGMGMGLAVSRSIINAHGGTIGARNNSGQGATFAFTLPLIREARTDGP
jgi:PAS domain S-box-containing protein